MEAATNGNEYTLMVEYDFSKPINAEIIFDSDEDESNVEMNSPLPEKHNSDHQNVTNCLDMPSLDGHHSATEKKLDNVIAGMIKKYVCETKKTCDKKSTKRKSPTMSDEIKNKLKRNMTHIKEKKNQHNEPSSRSPNNYNNSQLASFTAEPSGPPINVSDDIRSQNNSCISNTLTNTANEQPTSTSIEPKSERIEESIPKSSNYLSKKNSPQRNTSTSSLPPYIDNGQTLSICVDQQIEPIQNIVSNEVDNPLDTSNLPSIAYNGQPISACIELKAELIKDLNLQSNLYNETTTQEHISTSNLPQNKDNTQSACIEQRVEHSSSSTNDVSEQIKNGIDTIINQQNTSISSLPPNTVISCTLTNAKVSEVIDNKHNFASSSLPTNTNTSQPTSSNVPSKIQMQQNNDNSVTYDHLKPLLKTVSEHLILIWNRLHSCNGFIRDRCEQNSEFNEELRKKFYKYKIRLFDLLYSTVVNVMLPRVYDKTFVKDFIDNTVALSKSESRQTTKEISILYLEMINWTQKMKQKIASESVFDHEFMRQSLAPTATNTSGLPEIMKEPTHNTLNHTYSKRPPENTGPPPRIPRSNPPPPYTYNPAPYTNNPPPSSYTNNISSQYTNTMPPQTYYANNFRTPEQTKVVNSALSKHQQVSTKPMQKKKEKLNQRQQITIDEVPRREVNPDGPRQEIYTPNITLVNNANNNREVNIPLNHTGEVQNYQPTHFTTFPNHAHSAYNNNSVTANFYQTRATVESENQKFLRASKLRNLTNNNTSSQNQNHCYRPNDASTQGLYNYSNNTCMNQASNIQQESDRSSISRDSGFYSPRDFEEPPTSPLITYVTSLNPDAVNNIRGNCFVCGKNTNQKCVGCYATYYCSYGCQNLDWRNHMAYCNTNQELRKLLSK